MLYSNVKANKDKFIYVLIMYWTFDINCVHEISLILGALLFLIWKALIRLGFWLGLNLICSKIEKYGNDGRKI